MTKATYLSTIKHGFKYLKYNILLFSFTGIILFQSLSDLGRNPFDPNTGALVTALIGTIILASGLMGQLYMVIADAVEKGNK